METLVELSRVEETRHLVPNLPRLATGLFGVDSHFLDWYKSHIDWATQKQKHPDGLVWCPWKRELWLVEAEWKEGSNFFDQSRALASGRVDKESLARELRARLKPLDNVVNSATPSLKEGYVLDGVVEQTLARHVVDGEFRPHAWVVLGHDGDNLAKLRADYERELQARFRGCQRYILTMVRMFQSETTTFLLLEQHSSPDITIASAFLIPAVSQVTPSSLSVEQGVRCSSAAEATPHEPTSVRVTSKVATGRTDDGRASQIWHHLRILQPDLTRPNVRLRIQTSDDRYEDFYIDWEHLGIEMLVLHQGIRRKPSDAAKRAMAESLPTTTGNIARRYGQFVDVSVNPPRTIARYRDVETAIWKASTKQPHTAVQSEESSPRSTVSTEDPPAALIHGASRYFSDWTPHKARAARANILERRELWERFLEKRKMTALEFKQLSHFAPKAIAGFMRFVLGNGLATRAGDVFALNDTAVPHIRHLLTQPAFEPPRGAPQGVERPPTSLLAADA